MKSKILGLLAAVLMSGQAAAITLAFDDARVLGTVTPASPADVDFLQGYVNHLISMAVGDSDSVGSNTFTRSSNLFASLPEANLAGSVAGTGSTIDFGSGGVYTYWFAKYDGLDDLSFAWYVGDLSGVNTIPLIGPLGHGLSGWGLFTGSPSTVPEPTVPEPGTLALLGLGLAGLGLSRRRKAK
jgi:PEP-CTERM motif